MLKAAALSARLRDYSITGMFMLKAALSARLRDYSITGMFTKEALWTFFYLGMALAAVID